MGRLPLIFAAILSLPLWVRGQVTDCPQWPAPCPHSDEINQAMNIAEREDRNTVTAQEIAMENNIRNALTDLLQQFTRPRHWELYEMTESDYDRPTSFISYAQWRATPYEKRPPHQYAISFVIIVNRDSLAAWQDWYKNVLPAQTDQVTADMKAGAQNAQNDPVLQSLNDSVQYYAQLSAKYMQDNNAEYVRDVQNNNEKGIKRYNDKMTWYQKISDQLVKKIQDRSAGDMSAAGNSFDRIAGEKVIKEEQFINASVVLINFSVNPRLIGFGINGGDQRSITPQEKLTVEGAVYAGLLRNPGKPDGQSYYIGEHDYMFSHPSNIATVLFGKWQARHDSYNNVRPVYMADKTANDLVTVKPVKCDIIQSIAVQIAGSSDHIKKILSPMNAEDIKKLIVQ